MTVSYLDKPASVTLDANGNGTCYIKPDTGQFWYPTFVSVTTNSQNPPYPYTAIYHTVAGTAPMQTNFIDDTYLGNSDTSSIISGTCILMGEAIVAVIQGGNPGDTATVRVFGTYTDSPLDQNPVTPGTHFSGRLTFNTDVPPTLAVITAASISAGATVYYPGGGTNPGKPYQTSRYQSLREVIHSTSPGTTPYVGVEYLWYADAAAQVLINAEYFVFSSGNLVYYNVGQGPVRGPYLIVAVTNYDSSAGNFNMSLYGSQRAEVRTQFHSSSFNTVEPIGWDNILYANGGILTAGTHITTADWCFYNGPVSVSFWSVTSPNTIDTLTLEINPQPTSVFTGAPNQFTLSTPSVISANAPTNLVMTLPRRVCNGLISNNDTKSLQWHLIVWAQEI